MELSTDCTAALPVASPAVSFKPYFFASACITFAFLIMASDGKVYFPNTDALPLLNAYKSKPIFKSKEEP